MMQPMPTIKSTRTIAIGNLSLHCTNVYKKPTSDRYAQVVLQVHQCWEKIALIFGIDLENNIMSDNRPKKETGEGDSRIKEGLSCGVRRTQRGV